MGHESIVYGCIIGTSWKIENPNRLINSNKEVISNIIDSVEFPFLVRDNFAISGDNVIHGTYRSQVIHFGGSYKEIEWVWDEWLEKFESVIKDIYWDEIHIHLLTQLVGAYHYQYQPINYHENIYKTEFPEPPKIWKMIGGPRRFLETGPEYPDAEILEWYFEGNEWKLFRLT